MNFNYQRILVPVDGSSQSIVAFKTALNVAGKYQAHLTTVHIDEKHVTENDLRKLLNEHAGGHDYNYLHKSGSVAKEIVTAAAESDAQLIIMGTHGVTGFQEFWMGSNAYKVVTQAHCPVLTMKEEVNPTEFKKIILPIDTSFESRQKVPVAISLAKKFGSEVHIVGVSIDKDKEAEYRIGSYMRQVQHALNEAGVKNVSAQRLGGNITQNTIDYARSVVADLIIIMTEQELQIGSFFLGKFAQQMVNHSPFPVLSVPPRDDLMTTEARL